MRHTAAHGRRCPLETLDTILLALYGAVAEVAPAEFRAFAQGLIDTLAGPDRAGQAMAAPLAPHVEQAISLNRLVHGGATPAIAHAPSPLIYLSGREKQAVMLFGAGKSTKEIARELDVTHNSVRNFVQRAYKKLGVNDKAALAVLIGAWPAAGASGGVSRLRAPPA